mgnify:CR=1 FL=1
MKTEKKASHDDSTTTYQFLKKSGKNLTVIPLASAERRSDVKRMYGMCTLRKQPHFARSSAALPAVRAPTSSRAASHRASGTTVAASTASFSCATTAPAAVSAAAVAASSLARRLELALPFAPSSPFSARAYLSLKLKRNTAAGISRQSPTTNGIRICASVHVSPHTLKSKIQSAGPRAEGSM